MFTLSFALLAVVTVVVAIAAVIIFNVDSVVRILTAMLLVVIASITFDETIDAWNSAGFKAKLDSAVYTCEGYTTSAVQKEFFLCMDNSTRIVEDRHLGGSRAQYVAALDLIQIKSLEDQSALLHEAVHATLKDVIWSWKFFKNEAESSGYVKRITQAMKEQGAYEASGSYILDTEEMLARTVEACSGLEINSKMLDMYPTAEEMETLCPSVKLVLAEVNLSRTSK